MPSNTPLADETGRLIFRLMGFHDDYIDVLMEAEEKTEETVNNIKSSLDDLTSLGGKMAKLGAQASLAFTVPIKAAEATALALWSTQERSELVLEGVINANERGNAALLDQYKEFASGLQEITTVGDESTLSLLGVAESLGVTGKDAERAAKQAIAMSSALGIGEQAAIRYTTALAHGRVGMLQRYIPGLREMETEAEKVAAAHEYLDKMFVVATESAQTFGGQLAQLRNDVGDLFEMFGKILSDAIKPFISYLRDLVKWFQDLPESTKAVIIVFAELLAAIGPLVGTFGTLLVIAPAVKIALAGLAAHPVVLGVIALTAAVTVLVSELQHLNEVRREGQEIPGKMAGVVDRMSSAHQGELKELWEINKSHRVTNQDLEHAKELVESLEGTYGDLGLSVNETTGKVDGLNTAIKEILDRQARGKKEVLKAGIADIQREIDRVSQDAGKGFGGRFAAGFKSGKSFGESLSEGFSRGMNTFGKQQEEMKRLTEEKIKMQLELGKLNMEGLEGGPEDWISENQKKSNELGEKLRDTLNQQIIALQNKDKTQEEILFEQLKENELGDELTQEIQDQIDKYKELIEAAKKLKEEEKNRMDNIKKIADQDNDYDNRARQLTQQFRTPLQEARQAIRELNMYRGMGAISEETHFRGVKAAIDKYKSAMGLDEEEERPTFGAVQTISRGSVAEQVLIAEHRMAMNAGEPSQDKENSINLSTTAANTTQMRLDIGDLLALMRQGGITPGAGVGSQ